MTKSRIALTTLGLAVAVWAAPGLNAMDMDKGKHGKGQDMGAKHMEMMKKELGLSKDQAAKSKAATMANHEAMKTAGNKVKADLANLQVLVDKKASDAELTTSLNTLDADRKAMQAQQQKHIDAMRAILTPTQQAKMALKLGEHMSEGMMGKGMGGGMMHGGMGGMDHKDGKEGKPGHDKHDHDQEENEK